MNWPGWPVSLRFTFTRLRLERAAHRLKLSPGSVIDIALDAGYLSHEAFTRSFRSAFGMAPSQFRLVRGVEFAEVPSGIHYCDPLSKRFRTLSRGGKMKVEIKTLKPMRVAFMRHTGPLTKWARFGTSSSS